ncbi:MAG: hypothetical protein CBC42_01345 [Betaproteobacteria bacterium TMED82]|nr:MAG: hypothetical protein CBC42_01345 [Betaproteobacteria bacterium TMED82]|tara:strand:- start:16630 stop:18015 length:1386 start_codon:yes stop_codon:yes gene_type:complete
MSLTDSQINTSLLSGNNSIDSLIFDPNQITNWNWKIDDSIVRYSFDIINDSAVSGVRNVTKFLDVQQEHVKTALAYIDRITGLTHVEEFNSNNADIFFYNADIISENTIGLAISSFSYSFNTETGELTESDIQQLIYIDTDTQSPTDITPGTRGYETLLHELGHSLGLLDVELSTVRLDSSLDNTSNTLMSYNEQGGFHSEFQPLDIQALQFIYGGDGIAGTFGAYSQMSPLANSPNPSYAIFAGLEHLYPETSALASKIGMSSSNINSSSNEFFQSSSEATTFMVPANFNDLTVNRLNPSAEVWVLSSGEFGFDTIKDYNRISLADGILAIDIDQGEVAGQAYRLYQAAFARTPDIAGVAFHMNDIETNGLSITEVANNFLASPEFKGKYGDGLSDEDYINALYTNVLSRSPADFEVEYYVDRFNNGTTDKATTLVFFAESPENVTLVGSQIENGIFFPA